MICLQKRENSLSFQETHMTKTLIFESFLASAWFKTYQYITEHVERYVQVPTFLLNGDSLDDFASEYADVGFVNPLSYLWLLGQNPCPVELVAAPITAESADNTTNTTFYDVIARQGSDIQTINDLERCVWAQPTNDPAASGDDVSAQTLNTRSVAVREKIETSSQAHALHLLLHGQADATIIDTRKIDLITRNSPQMAAKLRTLATYQYAPGPLVVTATHIGSFARRKIQEALINIHTESSLKPYLQATAIDRFVPITNTQYQTLCLEHKATLAASALQQKQAFATAKTLSQTV
jgi:ABC-type phosphate/phosphonate transport system substrate-binding protein